MLNAARAQGIPMIVIAMTTAATSQPNAIHAPPRTIQMILSSSETGDIRKFYLAVRAIEIENRPRRGTRLPQAHQALNSGLNNPAPSADRKKRPGTPPN